MIFKTHPNNIAQIKAHIKAVGATYFHGDGNLYSAAPEDVLHSDNNVAYSNPKQEEAKYRVKFTSVDQVPDTVEELNEMLLKAKNNEILAERTSVGVGGVKTFAVEEPAAPKKSEAELEVESLRAELEKMKNDAAAKAKAEAEAKAKADKDAAAKAKADKA